MWGCNAGALKPAFPATAALPLPADCRVAHPPTVEALLELGADPNLVVPVPNASSPPPPLQHAVQVANVPVTQTAVRRVVRALLAAGADPLAVPRCGWGTALHFANFCGVPALEMMLAHLERLRAAGQLVLPSAEVATELMIAAARAGVFSLFVVAHEYVVAACGLRWRQQGAAAAAAAAAAEERRAARRSRDSDRSSSSSDDDGGEFGESGGAEAGCVKPQLGTLASQTAGGSPQQPPPRAPAWQPNASQLNETLRSSVRGGCPAILRCILASPLPFSVSTADATDDGLLGACALDGGSAETVSALHAAGARLSIQRLLSVLAEGVQPERLARLLAVQRPAVNLEYVDWRDSLACPVHVVLDRWLYVSPAVPAGTAPFVATPCVVSLQPAGAPAPQDSVQGLSLAKTPPATWGHGRPCTLCCLALPLPTAGQQVLGAAQRARHRGNPGSAAGSRVPTHSVAQPAV